MGEYNDGEYTEEVEYETPAGDDLVEVTIKIQNDTVAEVVITPKADHPLSQNYQELFQEGIGDLVVGKSINDIESFSEVNGSSLTPMGFQTALDKIKVSAKS